MILGDQARTTQDHTELVVCGTRIRRRIRMPGFGGHMKRLYCTQDTCGCICYFCSRITCQLLGIFARQTIARLFYQVSTRVPLVGSDDCEYFEAKVYLFRLRATHVKTALVCFELYTLVYPRLPHPRKRRSQVWLRNMHDYGRVLIYHIIARIGRPRRDPCDILPQPHPHPSLLHAACHRNAAGGPLAQ